MLDKGRSPLVILAVIVGIALLLSIFSYQYSILTSNKIRDIASQEVRSNVKIEVHDLTQILGKQLQTVSALLQTLTPSPLIQNNQNQNQHLFSLILGRILLANLLTFTCGLTATEK